MVDRKGEGEAARSIVLIAVGRAQLCALLLLALHFVAFLVECARRPGVGDFCNVLTRTLY